MTSYSYSSGWCERCGRRRGGDGRCANCDPWWTSGLVQVGAPLVAACAAALVFVISTYGVRPASLAESAGASSRSGGNSVLGAPRMNPGFPSAMLNTGFPSSPVQTYVASAPAFSSAPMPRGNGNGWQSSPVMQATNPETARWAELEQLRSMVWAAEAIDRNLPTTEQPSGPYGTDIAASSLEASPN